MRKTIFALALLLLAPLAAQAQVYPAPPNVGLAASRPVNCVASNPGQPQEPQWYFATDTSVLSICVATNTWQNTTGGGGGGIGGGGTAPFLSEWTNGTTLGNSLCQDLSTVLLCGESVSVGANAFMISKPNAASGTTQFLAVTWDANRNALTALPGNSVRGIAGLGAGTSGTVQIAIGGEYPWLCDNQTVINDWLVESTTTAGECHDVGASELPGVQNIAQVAGANSGSGTATLADIFTPDTTNAPAGPPTVIQVNGNPLASTTANFNSASPAAPANNVNLAFATDGLSPSGVSVAAPLATGSQAGFLELSTDLGGSYTAPNVVGIQGIPCTLSGTPVAGQVWGFNSPTACGNIFLGVAVRTVSSNSDPIVSTDREKNIRYTATSGATSVALPQAGSAGFTANIAFVLTNAQGSGTVTVTPTTSTINGAPTLAIPAGQYAFIYSDNSNYFANLGTISGSSGVTSVAMTVPGGFAVSGSPITSSGTFGLTTNAAGADYVFTSTAANTSAWEQINGGSNCGDATHALSYTTSTHLFGCQTISASGGYNTIDSNGSAVTQRSTVNFIPAGSANVSCVDNSGATRTDCTITGTAGPPSPTINTQNVTSYTIQNSDNTWRDVFTGSSAVAVTLPQAGQITTSPFVASRYSNGISCTTSCATSTFTQNSSDTMFIYLTWFDTATITGISDTAGDTFVRVQPDILNFQSNQWNLSVWQITSAIASASNAITVTMSTTPGAGFLNVSALEYSVASFGVASSGQSTNAPASATVNLPSSNALALAFTSGNVGISGCPTGWTARATQGGVRFGCERLLSAQATTSISVNYGPNTGSAIILAPFGITGISSFTAGWYVIVENSTTNLITVTPTVSTINGQTTLVLVPNESCAIMSDGANYNAICGTSPNLASNGVMGQKVEIAGVNTSATASDVGTTTLITTGAANAFYEVQAEINCTTSTSTAVETLTFTYTDTSNTTQSPTAQVTCTTLGTASIASMSFPFRAKASTNIQYATVHTTAQATYDVSVAIYQLATK